MSHTDWPNSSVKRYFTIHGAETIKKTARIRPLKKNIFPTPFD
jgi:hypothetical protein